MVATFDYKGFAKDLTKQAEDFIPKDIALEHKKEFLERIYNYTFMAGEALSNDDSIKTPDTAKVLTQIISEWTFHKYIDLLRSDIPEMYHENILQKLAYVAYEMAKESALSNLSEEEMLHLVEFQLKKAYEKSCKLLLDNGQITQSAYDNALRLSSVDDMSKHLCHNVKVVKGKASTFKYTVSMLCLGVVTLLVNVLAPDSPNTVVIDTIMLVVLSMYIGLYIGYKKFGK